MREKCESEARRSNSVLREESDGEGNRLVKVHV